MYGFKEMGEIPWYETMRSGKSADLVTLVFESLPSASTMVVVALHGVINKWKVTRKISQKVDVAELSETFM